MHARERGRRKHTRCHPHTHSVSTTPHPPTPPHTHTPHTPASTHTHTVHPKRVNARADVERAEKFFVAIDAKTLDEFEACKVMRQLRSANQNNARAYNVALCIRACEMGSSRLLNLPLCRQVRIKSHTNTNTDNPKNQQQDGTDKHA